MEKAIDFSIAFFININYSLDSIEKFIKNVIIILECFIKI